MSGAVATVPAMTTTLRGAVPAASAGVAWTDVVAAAGAAVAALAALATLVVAIVAVRYTRVQLHDARQYAKGQLDESRRLRREQAAPYVIVYARTRDEISPTIVEVVVENLGTTGARDVALASSPALVRTDQTAGGSQPVALPELIPFLAPHQSWRTFWDSAIARSESDLETRFTVTATYTDSFGTEHHEDFVLDWDQFTPRMYSNERTVHHIGKAVEDLAGTIKAWSRRNDIVRVATYDGAAFDERQARRKADRRAAHAELVRKLMPPTSGDTASDIVEDDPSA